MEKYIIYILKSGEVFTVGKVKKEQAARELGLHRSGKYESTRDWFSRDKDSINIYWLAEVEGDRGYGFKFEILWTRYFMDKGWTPFDTEANTVFYASSLKAEELEELKMFENEKVLFDKSRQRELSEQVEKEKKTYSSKSIQVNMNEDELEVIRGKAEEQGLSMSMYLRQLGLVGKFEKHDYSNLIKLNTELSDLGQSVKHLVYKDYPNKELVRDEIKDLTRSHDLLILEVRKLLRHIKKG